MIHGETDVHRTAAEVVGMLVNNVFFPKQIIESQQNMKFLYRVIFLCMIHS